MSLTCTICHKNDWLMTLDKFCLLTIGTFARAEALNALNAHSTIFALGLPPNLFVWFRRASNSLDHD